MALEQYLKQIRKYDILTREEEIEIFKKAKAGDIQAFNTIMQSNLRFVISVAKKYQDQGVDLEDLISEGNIGLVKAYHRFDYKLGYKFITYAVWWIRQSIMTAIHEQAKTIRLPLNKLTNVLKISKLKENFEQEQARTLTYDELAELIDDPVILQDLKYNYNIVDIDKAQTDNNRNLNEIIPDNSIDFDKNLDPVKKEIESILNEFDEREREIIKMYYGIGYARSYTLKEIGYDLGLTRERIRQIKENVLVKFRKKRRADRLKFYL